MLWWSYFWLMMLSFIICEAIRRHNVPSVVQEYKSKTFISEEGW